MTTQNVPTDGAAYAAPLGECPECGHRHYVGFGVYEPCPECECELGRET